MVPATSSKFDTGAKLRVLIASTLAKRAYHDPQIVKRGLADFDDPQLKQLIPDSRLRAGLATLEGTIGSNAIDVIRSGVYNQVRFGDVISVPAEIAPIAEVIAPPAGGTKPDIVFNQIYQYEDPRLLGVTLSHETLHQDPQDSDTEELIANYLTTLVYGQEVLENPSLARSGTALTRIDNTLLLAVINDRDVQGRLRLEFSEENIFPGGSVAVTTFASIFNPQPGDDTSGNAHLDDMLSQVTGIEVTDARFNQTTVDLLDQNQNLFSPTEIIAIAVILGLRV
jgi:hypothetical protein